MVDGLELDTVDAVKDEENDEITFTGEVTNLDLDQVQGARCWVQFNTTEDCLMPTQEFTNISEEGQFDLTETVILEDAEYFFKVKAEAINIFEDYDRRRAEKFEFNAEDFKAVIESEQFMDDNTESEEVAKWFNTSLARDVFYSADNWVNKGIYNRSQNADEDVLVDSDWTATSRDFDFITSDNTLMDEMTDSEQSMDDATNSEIAMDKVTDKELPMDKVTDKEVAMDKVTDKEVAMEVLSDKQFSFDFVLDNFDKENVEKFLSLDETKLMAVGKFVQGGTFIDSTGLSSENVTNIDTLTDSNDRMDEVTDSERAMDATTESELAMDKVTDKEIAMNKVTDKELPMDKVTDKEMANTKFMSSIVLSDTLYQQVSRIERLMFRGQHVYDSTESSESWNGVDEVWEVSDVGLPHVITDTAGRHDYILDIKSNAPSGFNGSIGVGSDDGDFNSDSHGFRFTAVDLSNVQEIKFRVEHEGRNGDDTTSMFVVNDDLLWSFNSGSDESWDSFGVVTVDVSQYGEDSRIIVAHEEDNTSDNNLAFSYFTDIRLIKED